MIGKFIEICQEKMTMFSKDRSAHVHHLRKIFKRYQK